ncbi:hypothetical protein CPG37_13435 [Malaciobacter canalis]|uniref:Uncharacterized protein n=1 Tax=Malaciobacter canalis TaxID=1912871 RepID=A0ABX4LLI0_9BACT|nr:hypothetical protein [Malaciobacter canalis]PHO08644.1 hypothetical protein CPG37_13435 [Malaciobacter canalis]QEE32839.1 putative membrane protein [Malaciobacter canalis]
MIVKILLGFILIAIVETINGIIRIKILQKYFRKYTKIISFLLGYLWIVIITKLFLSFINPETLFESFIVGLSWAIMMIIFDIFIGKVIFRLSWKSILNDFNIFKGNYLSFGIILIVFTPMLIYIN